jgi:hypothetical protein
MSERFKNLFDILFPTSIVGISEILNLYYPSEKNDKCSPEDARMVKVLQYITIYSIVCPM